MDKPTVHIVKIGGKLIDNTARLESFLSDFSKLNGYKILVHGGGVKATNVANKLGLQPKMTKGRRITDAANLEVAVMVYAGLLNKKIVAKLQTFECNAFGLSGADANCIKAHKRDSGEVDFGFAGDIDYVDFKPISILLKNKITPVFCAITHDKNGQLLNTNADTIASEISVALAQYFHVILTYCFDKKGVLKNINDENSVIDFMNTDIYNTLKQEKLIADGMLPKLHNSFYALHKGVTKVIIGSSSILKDENQPCTKLSL